MGIRKKSHNYFDFAIFPTPFDTLLAVLTTPMKKYMEKLTRYNMVLNGTGYIISVEKVR